MINPADGCALELSPLYFWGLQRDSRDPTAVDMYEYDHDKRGLVGFKTTQPSQGFEIEAEGEWSGIHEQIAAMRSGDVPCTLIEGLSLTSHES